MTMKMSEAIGGAMELVAHKRFRSAIGILERIRAEAKQQSWKEIAGFQLGVVYWSDVGDGDKARGCFQDAVKAYREDPSLAGQKLPDQCYANSCENMMVLSLSYEEYEDWAKALEKVQPQNHILLHQRPEFAAARKRGVLWSEVMESSSPAYYSRNPQVPDAGKYGCGASLWQLVLRHRKDVELAFDDWGTAVGEHVALTMRIATQAAMEMEKRDGRADADEVLFIMEPSLVFVDEYLAANPGEPTVQKLREQLVRVMEGMRGPGTGGWKDRVARPPLGLGMLLLAGVGAGVGSLVGWMGKWPDAWKWGLGVGAVLGLMMVVPAGMVAARTSACAACGRRLGLARRGMAGDGLGVQCRMCMRLRCGNCAGGRK